MAIILKSSGHRLTGKVVWADMYGLDEEENAFGMGVCLVEIAEEDQKFLLNAVSPVGLRSRSRERSRTRSPLKAFSSSCITLPSIPFVSLRPMRFFNYPIALSGPRR